MVTYDYDVAVIGGGSGGLACAKEAARCGLKVCLFDYVTPSTQGNKWGLGGTCVNVGCVPKKLFHYAASFSSQLNHDKSRLGYENIMTSPVDWDSLVQTVQNYVKQLNFGYRNSLRVVGVNYINALAKFKTSNELEYTQKGERKSITAENIVIATGGRPHIPKEIDGALQYAITSDDIFSLKRSPGKTLVVGASYIALECAGFLTELGFHVTVAVRSILLRGFDRQCSEKIGQNLRELGTKFYEKTTLKRIEKSNKNGNDHRFIVHFDGDKYPPEEFDTVLYATGRNADTNELNLEKIGVNVESNGKLKCINEQTNISNIYAVGDVLYGRPELTPVAIKAGELLARRLAKKDTYFMNYNLIPTTVFTPIEYGHCGTSEEDAIEEYGEKNLEVYLYEWSTLEISAMHREVAQGVRIEDEDKSISNPCLGKLICLKNENEKVIGFHYVGPHAGEVTQGMALALRLGARKIDFDNCIGIHPTDAEAFTAMNVTRRSGESWIATGGCGGGKCG